MENQPFLLLDIDSITVESSDLKTILDDSIQRGGMPSDY